MRRKRARHPSYHPNMVAERRCDTPWLRSRERISERIDEQVVDQSRLEAARADVAEAENNLATQVASDHEDPVELKTLADASKVLQQGTRGAKGQTHSRFQESSSVDWESRERTLQGTVEQIPDDPVPKMVEQLLKLPKNLSQDETQTVQTVEVPLLQFINKVVDTLVVVQRRVHVNRSVQEDHRDSPVARHR